MRILEKLWRPNPKDLAAGQIVQTRFTASAAFSTATATVLGTGVVTCPTNTVRIITMVNVTMTPGAAQIASFWVMQLVSNGTVVFGISQEPYYVKAAVAQWSSNVQLVDGVMLRPTDTLNVNAVFSAGAAANGLSVQLYGYDLPIGNVQ